MLFTLGFEVNHVDVALRIAGGDHHLHAHHLRAGRVGAVCARWNDANVAMALALGLVKSLDDQETCVFTLRARVGLQADACIAGGLAQPLAQLLIKQGVALELISRSKGVHVGKLGPGNWNHLAGGIELHGARAQRNHASVERQIFVAQLANVTQHAGFGVVAIEDWMCEECAGTAQASRNEGVATFFKRRPVGQGLAAFCKARPECFDVLA